MTDVDEMQAFWTSEINKCLDFTAPWKKTNFKQKRYSLPKEILVDVQKRKDLQKRYQTKVKDGKLDLNLVKEFKKQKNYCNKLIKRAVREKNGQNITNESSVNEVWNSINYILKPEKSAKSSLKIETENQVIEEPLELAHKFNIFFQDKVEKVAASINRNHSIDPLLKLKNKLHGSSLKFKLRTVSEKEVIKVMKSLKPKKSHGIDGITSEVLKLGAEVLAVPSTYIINSIVTGKFPTDWKKAKVIPLHKKGLKTLLKNFRPVSLLPVSGMILEKIVAIQIEDFFEKNGFFGSFQFGFRKHKNTISELLTLFDSLLEEKEKRKEILVLLYDLSAAFETVLHENLLAKLQIYGFEKSALKWMKSYLNSKTQIVSVSDQVSTAQEIKIGTPQGSRLSPLLFINLMADMDLWIENSMLTNFADDTQSIIICDNKEDAIETTRIEVNSVLNFFNSNNLVNNPEKAAILCNTKGKGSIIRVENIGERILKSTYSEKLLGLHINSDFEWGTHVDKLSIELKKRVGLLKRMKQRIPKNKLITIAEAIFNSKIRYGIAVYLTPVFEKEDLKVNKLSKHASILQILQNRMIRVILGIRKEQHKDMIEIRNKIQIMSVNQMCVYHTILEAHNVMINASSEPIKRKWTDEYETKYLLRNKINKNVKVPEKPLKSCTGFTYSASKLYNILPSNLKQTLNSDTFKVLTKEWVWKNIPSF